MKRVNRIVLLAPACYNPGMSLVSMPTSVAALVRDGRIDLGMSLREFGALIGVSQTYISDVENGRKPFPKRCVAKLPEPLRQRVAEALIREHEKAIAVLRETAA